MHDGGSNVVYVSEQRASVAAVVLYRRAAQKQSFIVPHEGAYSSSQRRLCGIPPLVHGWPPTFGLTLIPMLPRKILEWNLYLHSRPLLCNISTPQRKLSTSVRIPK